MPQFPNTIVMNTRHVQLGNTMFVCVCAFCIPAYFADCFFGRYLALNWLRNIRTLLPYIVRTKYNGRRRGRDAATESESFFFLHTFHRRNKQHAPQGNDKRTMEKIFKFHRSFCSSWVVTIPTMVVVVVVMMVVVVLPHTNTHTHLHFVVSMCDALSRILCAPNVGTLQ